MYKYNKNTLEICFVNYSCRLLLSFCKASSQTIGPLSPPPELTRLFSDPLPTPVSVQQFWFKIKALHLPASRAHHDVLSDLKHHLLEGESSPQTVLVALINVLSVAKSCCGTCSSLPHTALREAFVGVYIVSSFPKIK